MRFRDNPCNIVISGKWNPHIFSPPWLAEHLFDCGKGGNVSMELSIAAVETSTRFLDEKVILIPSRERLLLIAREAEDGHIARTEEMARKALELLSHTPVKGYGVNFMFEENYPAGFLLSLFNADEHAQLSSFGDVLERKIHRQIQHSQHCVLNMTFLKTGQGVNISLNFHHDLDNDDEFRKYVMGKALEYKNKGLELLQSVYELTLERDE